MLQTSIGRLVAGRGYDSREQLVRVVASGCLAPQWTEGSPVEAFEKIKALLADIEEDVKKAEGGNKAAGTRVRSVMQDVKNAAQEVRQKILEMRDAGKPQ